MPARLAISAVPPLTSVPARKHALYVMLNMMLWVGWIFDPTPDGGPYVVLRGRPQVRAKPLAPGLVPQPHAGPPNRPNSSFSAPNSSFSRRREFTHQRPTDECQSRYHELPSGGNAERRPPNRSLWPLSRHWYEDRTGTGSPRPKLWPDGQIGISWSKERM